MNSHRQGEVLTSPSPLVGEGRGEGASLLNNAKKLRANMTDAEQALWYQLRAKRFENYKFRRQVPMEKYIADFVCFEPKLIIEVDGGQHAEHAAYDLKRDAFFKNQGFQVLRLWNNEVLGNMEGVLTVVLECLDTPLPQPLPHKGGGEFNASSPTRGEGL